MENRDELLSQDFDQPIMLRPHHGMCLAYFKGYGYSDEFAVHMQKVQDYLKTDDIVHLAVETDIICSKCPNNINGACEKPELVARYDSEVLRLCNLSEGEELQFTEFFKLVQEKILEPGLRGEICGDCQWDEICK